MSRSFPAAADPRHHERRTNSSRGRQVRRALMALIRACHERGLLLPTYADLGFAVDLSDSQVSRHMGRLLDEGALQIARVGRRVRIKSIRP